MDRSNPLQSMIRHMDYIRTQDYLDCSLTGYVQFELQINPF